MLSGLTQKFKNKSWFYSTYYINEPILTSTLAAAMCRLRLLEKLETRREDWRLHQPLMLEILPFLSN